MVAHVALRIAFVVLGYFAGIASGSAAFACTLTLVRLAVPGSELWQWLGLGPVFFIAVPIFFFFVMWITVVMTFVQAVIANVITEIFALRALWVHLVTAAILGLTAGLILYPQWFSEMDRDRWLVTVSALAGAAVGGLVYWAIAGRNAGLRPEVSA